MMCIKQCDSFLIVSIAYALCAHGGNLLFFDFPYRHSCYLFLNTLNQEEYNAKNQSEKYQTNNFYEPPNMDGFVEFLGSVRDGQKVLFLAKKCSTVIWA